MISASAEALLSKLGGHAAKGLLSAVDRCVRLGHDTVLPDHYLYELLVNDRLDLCIVLDDAGVDRSRARETLSRGFVDARGGSAAKPSFSRTLLDWIEDAWVIASVTHDSSRVRSLHLLEALLSHPGLPAAPQFSFLREVNPVWVREQGPASCEGSVEEEQTPPASSQRRDGTGGLSKYTLNLVELAASGGIDPVVGRESEVRQLIDVLTRRRKNNPILVGEAGVGKTAVVEGLALRIHHQDVPAPLQGVDIRNLDLGLLQAGASVKGEFERRLTEVLSETRASETPVILFIDEAHTLIGAGGPAGTGDAANLLKPALARGELRTIAATTWPEYRKHIEGDEALARRFQMIRVAEPSPDVAVRILRAVKPAFAAHHEVHVTDDAVQAAVELSHRYIGDRRLPDKAIDLLDTACARVRMAQTTRPPPLEDVEHQLRALKIEGEALASDRRMGIRVEDGASEALAVRCKKLESERDDLSARWQQELTEAASIRSARTGLGAPDRALSGGLTDAERIASLSDRVEARSRRPVACAMVPTEVDRHAAAAVVSEWTGIDVGRMLQNDAARLLSLESELRSRVLGQDAALSEISDTLRTSRLRIRNPDAPLAVLLLVGPSGVGKTESARAVADVMFGGESFLTTINMTEYQESHSTSQLKGAPPGYVGFGDGGVMTEAVRKRPYSVLLLDEVEKAHADVMDVFYQVFDRGMMRDGAGRDIDFRNTVIIMTSNVGAQEIRRHHTDGSPGPAKLRQVVDPPLRKRFPAPLLGRMSVVPFSPLTTAALQGIVDLKLARVRKRLVEAHGVHLSWTAAVEESLAQRAEGDIGARSVEDTIQRTVLPGIAEAILRQMSAESREGSLELDVGESGQIVVLPTHTRVESADAPRSLEEDDPHAIECAEVAL